MSLLRLFSRAPLSFLYICSDVVFFILFYITRYRRTISLQNISNSFPEKSREEILQIQKNAYRYISDSLFELIKAFSINENELRRRVSINKVEEIAEVINKNRPALLLSAHTAPTEWVAQLLHLSLNCYIDPVYKPAHSKSVDRFIFSVRSRYEATPIPYKKLAKDVIARKKVVRCIAVLADLEPRRREQTLKINFLNQPTRFFLSIERIAKLSDMPVFFIAIKKTRRGHYKASVIKLCDSPNKMGADELTKKYVGCIENVIKQKPEAWLWTHRRWKHSSLN